MILQPAPGALQAPRTARLFLRFNSLAPNILHPPTAGSLFLPSALFPQGGELPGRRGKKKKDFSWNRDTESAVFIYGFSVRIALFFITPRIPFLFLSVSLFQPPPLLCPPLFLGGWRVLLRSHLMGKTQKKEEKQKTGNMSGQTGV